MIQKRKPLSLYSICIKLLLSIALIVGFVPMTSQASKAYADETDDAASSQTNSMESEITLDESDKPIDSQDDSSEGADGYALESLDILEAIDKGESYMSDGIVAVEQTEITPTEAEVQIPNSFRYKDGEPIKASDRANDRDIMTLSDIQLLSGASGYPSFSYGPCAGSDAAKGVDVSSYQGNIDWGKVKLSGVNFAIIRCGTGQNNDSYFAANVNGCKSAGVRFGVYYYSYATDPAQGVADAQRVISQLRNAGVSAGDLGFPIYYDLEDEGKNGSRSVIHLSASQKAELTKNFVNTLHNAGYPNVGVYSSLNWWRNYLTDAYFNSSGLFRWVAHWTYSGLGYGYSDSPFSDFRSRGDVWQFSDSGRISGISTDVDLDYSYYNMINSSSEGSMFRLYNPNSGEHFYTASSNEGNTLINLGWRYEGVAWIAPTRSSTPVYRLYNPNAGDHHYTVDSHEKDVLASLGWRYEGIGWHSNDSRSVPLYRLYNPNARAGAHHYTRDSHEKDVLASIGWRYEGVGWYGR